MLDDAVLMSDIAADTHALAAAAPKGGWQLQCLSLHASCPAAKCRCTNISWQQVCSALGDLATAFPLLEDLDIKLPLLGFDPVTKNLDVGSAIGSDVHAASWLANMAVVAALANAVVRLKRLEVLTMTGVPDSWALPKPLAEVPAVLLSSESAAAQVEAADALLANGLLPSVTAAGATFPTMDDCGRWLLRHLPRLTSLRIVSWPNLCEPVQYPGIGWSMSWQPQQQQLPAECAAGINTTSSSLTGCSTAAIAAAEETEPEAVHESAIECHITHASYSPGPYESDYYSTHHPDLYEAVSGKSVAQKYTRIATAQAPSAITIGLSASSSVTGCIVTALDQLPDCLPTSAAVT